MSCSFQTHWQARWEAQGPGTLLGATLGLWGRIFYELHPQMHTQPQELSALSLSSFLSSLWDFLFTLLPAKPDYAFPCHNQADDADIAMSHLQQH